MTDPALVLELDSAWDFHSDRPVPLEPYRRGCVLVRRPQILETFPVIRERLEHAGGQASYINPFLVRGNDPLLTLARRIWREGDKASAALIASLSLPASSLDEISWRVQRDLAAIQCGPNQDMIKPVLEEISHRALLDRLAQTSTERPIHICDPFGGVGILALAVAKHLQGQGIGNLVIHVLDIQPEIASIGQPLLQRFLGHSYPEMSRLVRHKTGDGLSLSAMDLPTQFDLIIGSLAWHEFPSSALIRHLSLCKARLIAGGHIIVTDTSREPRMLRRAGWALPLLSRTGLAVSALQYTIKYRPDDHFLSLLHSAVREGRWLRESGYRSYACGLLPAEVAVIIQAAGFDPEHCRIEMRLIPPIGYLLISLST